jgi:uncharacterized protein (UPF0332 family)
MDQNERDRRWQAAKAKLGSARLCQANGFYGESITCAYYASYQAMWVAVGDPPRGLWRHGGLINEFCRGRWFGQIALPALAQLRRKLDKLYRIKADYQASNFTQSQSRESIEIAEEVLELVSNQTGLAL